MRQTIIVRPEQYLALLERSADEWTRHDLKQRKVGTRVTCAGFPGTIRRVLDDAPTMVEVQLKSGLVAVCFTDCEVIQ